jgi:hypothetical protein
MRLSMPAIGGVRVGKVATDVAEPGRAEQGIAECMDGHVAVRMREQSLVVRDLQAAEHQRASGAETMGVEALTDEHVG